MNSFLPAELKLFFSRQDADDVRVGELVRPASMDTLPETSSGSVALLGYPDDEGIRLNGGKTGAGEGPTKIREYLYKMTPPAPSSQIKLGFYDLGDLNISKDSLAARHQIAAENNLKLYSKDLKILSLGGGHDYGYADASAFLRNYIPKGIRPVVLNLDAHLDVRPDLNGFNSGTPFYRLLNEFKGQFDFIELGVQPHCNSVKHADWAKSMGAKIFYLSEIELQGGLSKIIESEAFTKLNAGAPLFISFDIDGLCSQEAPGCSQSWATGLHVADYLNFFKKLILKFDVRGLGIYEVSPPLDVANITSKTAAIIAYHFLFEEHL